MLEGAGVGQGDRQQFLVKVLEEATAVSGFGGLASPEQDWMGLRKRTNPTPSSHYSIPPLKALAPFIIANRAPF